MCLGWVVEEGPLAAWGQPVTSVVVAVEDAVAVCWGVRSGGEGSSEEYASASGAAGYDAYDYSDVGSACGSGYCAEAAYGV